MTPKRPPLTLVLLAASCFLPGRSPAAAAESGFDPAAQRVPLALHAGPHDRADTFVSVLLPAGPAKSAFVEYADGTLGRAQLLEPGMLNADARRRGMKELHFIAPKMRQGETARVVALLSERPVEGRTYVWSGESRQSRRVSCMPCHQGLAMPTAEELRQEGEMLEKTGQVPPLQLPRLLPTAKGHDSRWHDKLGKNLSSACWECHARHMVQYEYGQSLARDVPWAPDPPEQAKAQSPPAVRSVFHTVFRVRRERTLSHPLSSRDSVSDGLAPWGIHYGFDRATVGGEPCSGIIQQHAGTLSEEAGKFIGRHNVRIDWVGTTREKRQVIAREERQVTVKDYRGRNKSYAMWLDFVSTLTPVAGAVQFDGAAAPAGFHFVPAIDADTAPKYRASALWRAITFVSEGTTYTVVCFNQPNNPRPVTENAADRAQAAAAGAAASLGYSFSAKLDDHTPLLTHYRMWLQGGNMPSEEIELLSHDLVTPISIDAK